MNIGIITVAFNEKELIVPCIKQFQGFNFPHLIMVSKKPWRGSYEMDETWALAKMAVNNGEVIVDEWPGQAEQFNEALGIFEAEGIDWALIVDADEFYTPEDIGRLVGQIRSTEYDALLATNMDVYWKTPDYKVIPDQWDYPVVAIKTSKRFKNKRHVEDNVITTNTEREITLHHMSYVRTHDQMMKKIETFEHSHEFNTDQWFYDIWTWWNPDAINLHPTVPTKFGKAVYNPAPEILRNLINWNS